MFTDHQSLIKTRYDSRSETNCSTAYIMSQLVQQPRYASFVSSHTAVYLSILTFNHCMALNSLLYADVPCAIKNLHTHYQSCGEFC